MHRTNKPNRALPHWLLYEGVWLEMGQEEYIERRKIHKRGLFRKRLFHILAILFVVGFTAFVLTNTILFIMWKS